MKQSEIQIGGEYLTRVGDSLVRVRVTSKFYKHERGTLSTAFNVERVGPKPKRAHHTITPRSAARLRPVPECATVKASVESVSLKVTVES